MTDQTDIRYAVIQNGYAVFGVGSTPAEAITDAAGWMESKTGTMTAEAVAARLVNRHSAVDGDFCLIDSTDDEFSSYLRNQGGFEVRSGKWYPTEGGPA